ncbi:flagellar hook-length control protein FliK [Sinomonas sp.]|uniref:flagellar hook-length control protein FliK n=1 Tax=Sinomonas sp. TaxID=1914986 RepID=UPI003F7F9F43
MPESKPSAHPTGEPTPLAESAPEAALPPSSALAPSSALPVVTAQPLAPLTPSVPNPAPIHDPVAVPVGPQLAKPIFTLATGAPGVQVMTVKVTPENLGPVTVQAHIGAEGVKVELFAPTDAARAAVQAVLPDLRRDLADAGLAASLDLSERNAPHEGARDGGGSNSRDSPRRGRREEGVGAVLGARASPARAAPFLSAGSAAGLDILA